jgi:RNA polymerase sigma-70 factor (ECF subfamily)
MNKKEKDKTFLDAIGEFKEDLWRYCLYISKDYHLSREIMSIAITKTYENFIRNKVDNIKSYCFTIARNQVFKKHNISESISESSLESGFRTDKQSEVKIVMEYLEKINPKEKEAIILSKIQGFSRKEIAELSQASEETVKSRIARGLEKLRNLLGVYNDR